MWKNVQEAVEKLREEAMREPHLPLHKKTSRNCKGSGKNNEKVLIIYSLLPSII